MHTCEKTIQSLKITQGLLQTFKVYFVCFLYAQAEVKHRIYFMRPYGHFFALELESNYPLGKGVLGPVL